jgi:hypothetical protein
MGEQIQGRDARWGIQKSLKGGRAGDHCTKGEQGTRCIRENGYTLLKGGGGAVEDRAN